ncbi:MAG TPA: sigma-54-dependent Fis family transcriptional regulator [Rhodocyclaceae bacterium]|nr:sigma-54-dependent Fis family transcriptional regulator [Rhodocyclaceae bacterium]
MRGLPQTVEARDQRVALARRMFFGEGALPEDDLDRSILRSWQRCRQIGLEFAGDRIVDPAGRARLSESRERSASLLDHASGVMEHVFEQIRASGSMVILADLEGMIIHSLGDPDFVDRASRVALQPGACWSETLRGTNAIGTAIAESSAVEVLGCEHYLERNGFLTCTASPIFDVQGNIVGVFDISGDYRSHQPHTLGLVRLSVQLLEKRLFEAQFAKDILIAFHVRPEYIGSLQEALVAVSEEGAILGANQVARAWLASVAKSGETPSFAGLFKPRFGTVLDRAAAAAMSPNAVIKLDLRDGGALYVQVRGYRPSSATSAGESETATAAPRGVAKACDRTADKVTLDCLATGDERQQRALERARRVAGKDIPLLVQGESGVGKELFARAFHNSGPRAQGPFVALNCAAIPENLIESELFGYVGGAFTGARREGSIGKIQQAHGGTLFLDEIGDMPLNMQARLLRVLQERSVTPVGALKAVPVDISLVCATHRVLKEAIGRGEFREDLYYRVNGLTVTLPPLRERSDIRSLVRNILADEAASTRSEEITISEDVLRFFERYPWPGNIRQLQNVIRVSVALLDDDETEVMPVHLPEELFASDPSDDYAERRPASVASPPVQPAVAPEAPVARSLDQIELEAIAKVMREVGGNVSAAARRLGVSRNTLYRKLGRMS